MGFTALYLKHRTSWRGLAGQRAHEWMARACGGSAMETVWTPLLKGKFDRHYNSVSMAWLWARIHIRANSRGPGGGREKLGYFRGGFNVITSALENEIRRRGVNIRTRGTVEKFSADERAAIVNGEKVPFDFCVFTGPSPAFAGLLPAHESLPAISASAIATGSMSTSRMRRFSFSSTTHGWWTKVSTAGKMFITSARISRRTERFFRCPMKNWRNSGSAA